MEFEYLFAAAAFIILLLLGMILKLVYSLRKMKHTGYDKEKLLADQSEEIIKQNKFLQNVSSLYDSLVLRDKIRTEFFTNIVHELKTPLSVILGALQLTEAKRQDASSQDKAAQDHGNHTSYNGSGIIKINCYRLIRLTNNLLDLVKSDSGYLKLNPAVCDMTRLVEEITQSVVPYAEQKKISLVFDTTDEEIIISLDIEKIERIVLNLLSNAIKFTPPGGCITAATCVRSGRACISVKDNGIGIPKDKQDKIFERFEQVCSRQSRANEGSGIGLSLVKSFVDLHQGNIQVTSEQGLGSEFVIDLPLKRVEPDEEDSYSVSELHGNILEAINIEFSDIRSIAS